MEHKREIKSIITEHNIETSKFSVYGYLNTNRNSFDALSEIGMVCRVFFGAIGLSLALISSFFGVMTQLNNIGIMLLFFSFVLLMIGVGNRIKIAKVKKPPIAR